MLPGLAEVAAAFRAMKDELMTPNNRQEIRFRRYPLRLFPFVNPKIVTPSLRAADRCPFQDMPTP